MLWRVHPVTPQKRTIDQIVEELRNGEIFIVPTDTVYAFVCLMHHPHAINELYRIKGIPTTQHLSLLCRDVAMASYYAHGIPNAVFRFMKNVLPGPYTFILQANRNVDRRQTGKKKTVGIRIVNHPLHLALMERLDVPLISTSITVKEEITTDPEDLDRLYGHRIHAVIDGGIRYHDYSTILDCTSGDFYLLRQGIGDVSSIHIVNEADFESAPER